MKYKLLYKGYSLTFEYDEKLIEIFSKHNINFDSFISNTEEWFEVVLFEIIQDEDGNDLYGKDFIIVFRSIVYRYVDSNPKKELFCVVIPSSPCLYSHTQNIQSQFLLEFELYEA